MLLATKSGSCILVDAKIADDRLVAGAGYVSGPRDQVYLLHEPLNDNTSYGHWSLDSEARYSPGNLVALLSFKRIDRPG